MYPIIDFRNGRYQGQTKNQLPDGVGILIDKNFLFCVAEWVAGQIKGTALIFYPDGLVFSGQIAFKQPDQLCTFQLPADHVKLINFAKQRKARQISKIAAVMPLLKIILQIDNTNEMQAKVLKEYQYSIRNENQNITCVNRILNLDRTGPQALMKQRNCIQFLQEYFAFRYEDIFQFMINQNKGKKEYFFGLRGEGLGIRIEPLQELGVSFKQTGRVYHIRAVGHFTKQNQMKDIGFKTLDNAMKGVIYEQGVYSLPNTIIKYQAGKRPVNCVMNFYYYIKRSMYYRDKVIDTDYIYDAERFVLGFNQNLRKAETQRLAQYTIENPNNTGQNLKDIQQKRGQKERQRELYLKQRDNVVDTPNPYNPNVMRYTNPNFNLQNAKDEILRSVSKKKSAGHTINHVDYGNVDYIDPNYLKVDKQQKQPRNHQMFQEKSKDEHPRYRYDPDYFDNLQNRYTPKKYYPSRTANYYSGGRDVPQRRFITDSKYHKPVGQYTTPPKRNNYETVGDHYLQQTRPKHRYDYLYEGERENMIDDSYNYPRRDRSITPDRNLRRHTIQSNRFN